MWYNHISPQDIVAEHEEDDTYTMSDVMRFFPSMTDFTIGDFYNGYLEEYEKIGYIVDWDSIWICDDTCPLWPTREKSKDAAYYERHGYPIDWSTGNVIQLTRAQAVKRAREEAKAAAKEGKYGLGTPPFQSDLFQLDE